MRVHPDIAGAEQLAFTQWKPEPGDVLNGFFGGWSRQRQTRYGRHRYAIVVNRAGRWAVWTWHRALRVALKKAKPRELDRIRLERLPDRTNAKGHTRAVYTVAVPIHKPANAATRRKRASQ